MVAVHLLGTPEIVIGDQRLVIQRKKSRGVLYFIAGHRHPVLRVKLLGLFWPDLAEVSARQVLRTTLSDLKKQVGDVLHIEAEHVALDERVWIDALKFESLLTLGTPGVSQLEEAAGLYRGEFLSGISIPALDEFQHWVTVEQERYRRLLMGCLSKLSDWMRAQQDYSKSLEYLDRALEIDPLQEDIQRESIRLQHLAGDRAGAIRRYDVYRKRLDDQLGVPPMLETRQLYDAIVRDELIQTRQEFLPQSPLSSRKVRGGPTERQYKFVGRRQEMSTLREAVKNRKFVLIEGEAGIGKTRLVHEFFNSSPHLVLDGSAHELEQPLPYQPFIDALRGLTRQKEWGNVSHVLARMPHIWRQEIGRLIPELSDDQRAELQPLSTGESRIWEGMYQFLQGLAAVKPVAVWIDDLQWADEASLGLLGFLVRRSRQDNLFFCATSRSVSINKQAKSLIHSLQRMDNLVRVSLGGLKLPDVYEIAQVVSSSDARSLSDWLYQNSEGNPYFLTELIQHAKQLDILSGDGIFRQPTQPQGLTVPPSLNSLIQSRLDDLSDPARRLLEVAAITGYDFEIKVVIRASGLSELSAFDALDELTASGLLEPGSTGERLTYRHVLISDVIREGMNSYRIQSMHRHIAETIEKTFDTDIDSIAGRLAFHYLEGRLPEKAAHFALIAARNAASLSAWAESIRFYEIALAGNSGQGKLDTLIETAHVLARSGQFARSSEVYHEAIHSIPKGDQTDIRFDLKLSLAKSMLPQARFSEAIGLAENVLASCKSGRIRGEAEQLLGTAYAVEGTSLDKARFYLIAAESHTRHDDPLNKAGQSSIQFELGSIAAQQGDLELAINYYLKSLEIVNDQDDEDSLERKILAYNNLAYHYHLLGSPQARIYGIQGLKLAQEKGILAFSTYLYSTLGEIELEAGNLEEAEKLFTQGLTLSEEFGVKERIAGLTANLGLVSLRRGEANLAIHQLSSALSLSDSLGTKHLSSQIRVWLSPLLPKTEALHNLTEARAFAETSGRKRLLDEILAVEKIVR